MTDHDTLSTTSPGSDLVNRNDWEEAQQVSHRKKEKTPGEKTKFMEAFLD